MITSVRAAVVITHQQISMLEVGNLTLSQETLEHREGDQQESAVETPEFGLVERYLCISLESCYWHMRSLAAVPLNVTS